MSFSFDHTRYDIMKPKLLTLFILGNSLIGLTSAATIVDQDFAGMSSDQFTSSGWVQSSGRGRPVSFPIGNYLASNNWGQNQLWTNLSSESSIKLGTENATYTFDFKVHSAEANVQNLFCLSGDDFSLFLGTSYNSDTDVNFGTKNSPMGWSTFQGGGIAKDTPESHSGVMISHTGFLTYKVSLETTDTGSNTLLYTVTDGTNSYTATHSFDSTSTLNKLGFLIDGATNQTGVYNVKAVKSLSVPEPTTASLALLGVASFFIRRRRA